MENKFLDITGLNRLVMNIKDKFQKKKIHCQLYDNGGGAWSISFVNTNEVFEITKGSTQIYQRLNSNGSDLIFDIIGNNQDVFNNHYNVNYQINTGGGDFIIIVINIFDDDVHTKITLNIKKYINGEITFSHIPTDSKSAYPVGSIYISTVSTNPTTLLGFGVWERIKDRFLLAAKLI